VKAVKNNSGKKSYEHWEEIWKTALSNGKCPFEGCDLRSATCWHLDKYLSQGQHGPGAVQFFMGKGNRDHHLYTQDIDDFSIRSYQDLFPDSSPWELYKALKPFRLPRGLRQGRTNYLTNDQILLLIYKYCLDMTNERIVNELGWSGPEILNRRLKRAMEVLRNQLGGT
jgi:hypothetical protein